MRTFKALTVAIALAELTGVARVQSSPAVTTVTATFGSRSALSVSSPVLEFQVIDPGQPVTASIEFVAAARTCATGEVRLDVVLEPGSAVRGPGGAADVETILTLETGLPGIQSGVISTAAPTTAARWTGSGRRTGRLAFSLRASAPGTYTVPVRFFLNVP
jgi:hypothetical protein